MPQPVEIIKPHFLIAEDDYVSRKAIGLMLQKADFEIDFAEDGLKAVEMWESGEYDLILMDIQMPRMNGFEATAAIRDKERTRGGHTPIIALTAHALKEDKDKCLNAGMNAFISKPIDFARTLLVIRETLRDKAEMQV
ncbi:MAG: response regulator [Verrucomicrobia bacterium]|nr:response regulator [Deltaproteobacteria bacterium]